MLKHILITHGHKGINEKGEVITKGLEEIKKRFSQYIFKTLGHFQIDRKLIEKTIEEDWFFLEEYFKNRALGFDGIRRMMEGKINSIKSEEPASSTPVSSGADSSVVGPSSLESEMRRDEIPLEDRYRSLVFALAISQLRLSRNFTDLYVMQGLVQSMDPSLKGHEAIGFLHYLRKNFSGELPGWYEYEDDIPFWFRTFSGKAVCATGRFYFLQKGKNVLL